MSSLMVVPGRASDAGPELRTAEPRDFLDLCFDAADAIQYAREAGNSDPVLQIAFAEEALHLVQ